MLLSKTNPSLLVFFCIKNIVALCAPTAQKNCPLEVNIRVNKITHTVSCEQWARKLDASFSKLTKPLPLFFFIENH